MYLASSLRRGGKDDKQVGVENQELHYAVTVLYNVCIGVYKLHRVAVLCAGGACLRAGSI